VVHCRFEGSQCPARLLEEISLVDTPGVLSGEKQRIERNYNFIDACEWFATRCDLILLLFDPYKLDISDEFKQVRGGVGSADGCCMSSAGWCTRHQAGDHWRCPGARLYRPQDAVSDVWVQPPWRTRSQCTACHVQEM
jgi:hypothetical protein